MNEQRIVAACGDDVDFSDVVGGAFGAFDAGRPHDAARALVCAFWAFGAGDNFPEFVFVNICHFLGRTKDVKEQLKIINEKLKMA